jgi:hypothetical protein
MPYIAHECWSLDIWGCYYAQRRLAKRRMFFISSSNFGIFACRISPLCRSVRGGLFWFIDSIFTMVMS